MSAYPGGYLAKTYPAPTGPTSTNVAPGVWTLGQQAAFQKAGLWPDPAGPLSPAAKDMTILLHGDGTNGAQTNSFLDSSSNALTITPTGTTYQNTYNPYGAGWSTWFDGDGDYLTIPDHTSFNLSGGSFTIEFWIRPNGNYGNYRTMVAKRNGSATAWEVYLRTGTGVLSWYNGSNYESSAVPVAGVWNFITAVYDGTYINLYLNGSRVLRSAVSNTDISSQVMIAAAPPGEYFTGAIADLRITKGAALYTGTSFSVPTARLSTTVPSGTVSLLTCTPDMFTGDLSSNNHVVTRNNGAKTNRGSPFVNYEKYAYTDYGGSVRVVNGYLTAASSAGFAFGTGDYAVETWVYPMSTSQMTVFEFSDANDTVKVNTTNAGTVSYYNGSTTTTSASGLVGYNTWSHIALVRNSGTVTVYVNGITALTQATTPNTASNRTFTVGGPSTSFVGYLSNTRVVKGYPIYTTNFNVPTTKLTAVPGTQVLLLNENSAIADSAMRGNFFYPGSGSAQLSTAQKKYGSASLYLPSAGQYFATGGSDQQLDVPFTWECWWYGSNNSNWNQLWTTSGSWYGTGVAAISVNSTLGFSFSYYVQGFTNVGGYGTGIVPPNNQWVHLAVTRDENFVWRFFINGVLKPHTRTQATWNGNNYGPDVSQNIAASTGFNIGFCSAGGPGAGYAAEGQTVGYIDDFRIVSGQCLYTTDFTPPGAALPNK